MENNKNWSNDIDSLTEITGTVEEIVFKNENTRHTIAKVKMFGQWDPITIVFNFGELFVGEILQMKGKWEKHYRYGDQFIVLWHSRLLPTTTYAIRKFLKSGVICCLGSKMADRIVDKFGDNTLDIIDNQIELLEDVEGIGTKRIELIKIFWKEFKKKREFLQRQSLSFVSPYHPRHIPQEIRQLVWDRDGGKWSAM